MLPRIAVLLCLAPLLAAAAPDVRVEAIAVAPASPGPSALCQLKVRLKNAGSRPASNFRFSVKIDGQDAAVYKQYTYAIAIDPGASEELTLHNFYSPVQARAFAIQVNLVEAQWLDVKREGASIAMTPAGAVEGLPAGASLTVKMPGAK